MVWQAIHHQCGDEDAYFDALRASIDAYPRTSAGKFHWSVTDLADESLTELFESDLPAAAAVMSPYAHDLVTVMEQLLEEYGFDWKLGTRLLLARCRLIRLLVAADDRSSADEQWVKLQHQMEEFDVESMPRKRKNQLTTALEDTEFARIPMNGPMVAFRSAKECLTYAAFAPRKSDHVKSSLYLALLSRSERRPWRRTGALHSQHSFAERKATMPVIVVRSRTRFSGCFDCRLLSAPGRDRARAVGCGLASRATLR